MVYLFAIALMLSLFTTNGYLMQSVIEEKETRLIEILISTVRPGQLLVGKICALGLLGLLQITLWVGSMYLVTRWLGGETLDQTLSVLVTLANIKLPLDIIPLLLVYFVLAYFMFAGLLQHHWRALEFAARGTAVRRDLHAPGGAAALLPRLFTTEPNGTIPVILSIFPLTAPLAMTQRLGDLECPGVGDRLERGAAGADGARRHVAGGALVPLPSPAGGADAQAARDPAPAAGVKRRNLTP